FVIEREQRGQMPTSRMPQDVYARRISSVTLNVANRPRKGCRYIFDLRRMPVYGRKAVTRNHYTNSFPREVLADPGILGTVAQTPCPAVYEHHHRKLLLPFRQIEVQLVFVVCRQVGDIAQLPMRN